jgi:hypothetical protein
MANYNCIRENEKQIMLFLNIVVDESSPNRWKDIQHVNDFKYGPLRDYFIFQHDLHQLKIEANSNLYEQYTFGQKLWQLTEKFNKEGIASLKADLILDMVERMIIDWFQNDRDLELKKKEKEHYTKLSFMSANEQSPSSLNHGRIAQQKEMILRNTGKNLHTNLG